jgi:hypothetical protein
MLLWCLWVLMYGSCAPKAPHNTVSRHIISTLDHAGATDSAEPAAACRLACTGCWYVMVAVCVWCSCVQYVHGVACCGLNNCSGVHSSVSLSIQQCVGKDAYFDVTANRVCC